MGKIKKFTSPTIRQIAGGKDPLRLVEEFVVRQGFDPTLSEREKGTEACRWVIDLGEGKELELLIEGLRRPAETTIYLGINVITVPLRGAQDMLVAALEIADGLIGIKVSLVGHSLVLSTTLGASGVTSDELDYSYKLILAQFQWFKDALAEELDVDELWDS